MHLRSAVLSELASIEALVNTVLTVVGRRIWAVLGKGIAYFDAP